MDEDEDEVQTEDEAGGQIENDGRTPEADDDEVCPPLVERDYDSGDSDDEDDGEAYGPGAGIGVGDDDGYMRAGEEGGPLTQPELEGVEDEDTVDNKMRTAYGDIIRQGDGTDQDGGI